MKNKFGIKTKQDEENIEEVLESKSNIGRRKNKRKLRNEQALKDDLVNLLQAKKEQEELEELMTDAEKMEAKKEKAKLQ